MKKNKNELTEDIVLVENNKHNITIKHEDTTIELIEDNGSYTYTFQKSLSNVRNTSDILPLSVENTFHASCSAALVDDEITLTYKLDNNISKFSEINKYERHEKLRVLRNVGNIFTGSINGYTYLINPENLIIDDNKLVKVIYVGYSNTLIPLEQNEEQNLRQYKCLITSVMDSKYDFETLYNGQLEICKKTMFLDKIYQSKTIDEVLQLVESSYLNELKTFNSKNRVVVKSRYNSFRLISVISVIGFVLSVAVLIYFSSSIIPTKNKYIDANTSFVSENYDSVISILRNDDPKDLPIDQLYILAQSYIQKEPLNAESKENALNKLTIKSDRRSQEYWVYIGRDDYETAISLAKSLQARDYEYHATFRAINIITNDRVMDGSTKESKLKSYNDALTTLEEENTQTEIESVEENDSTNPPVDEETNVGG